MLNIAQCSDRKKVLYASGRLTGPTVDWWDSYVAAHDAADTITWAEFSTQFRNYHIPAGLMKRSGQILLDIFQEFTRQFFYTDIVSCFFRMNVSQFSCFHQVSITLIRLQ